jgi:hypothetical protein
VDELAFDLHVTPDYSLGPRGSSDDSQYVFYDWPIHRKYHSGVYPRSTRYNVAADCPTNLRFTYLHLHTRIHEMVPNMLHARDYTLCFPAAYRAAVPPTPSMHPTSPLPHNDPRISQRLANDLQPYNAMEQTVSNISSHGVIYPSYGAPDVPTLIRSMCIRYERVNQSIHWISALRVFCGTAGSGDLLMTCVLSCIIYLRIPCMMRA